MPTSPRLHAPDRQLHHCSHTGVVEIEMDFSPLFPLLLSSPSSFLPFFLFPFLSASSPSPPLSSHYSLHPPHMPSHMQAMSAHVGSVVDGPTSSGKVQLIKGIGLLCGRFVPTFHCSALLEKATIARIFEGLAQVLIAAVKTTAQWRGCNKMRVHVSLFIGWFLGVFLRCPHSTDILPLCSVPNDAHHLRRTTVSAVLLSAAMWKKSQSILCTEPVFVAGNF